MEGLTLIGLSTESITKIKDKCGVDLAQLVLKIMEITTLFSSAKTTGEQIALLEKDDNFKKISEALEQLNQLSPDKLGCILDSEPNIKPLFCSMSSTISSDIDPDKTLNIVNKYKLQINNLVEYLYNMLLSLQKNCGSSQDMIIKSRKLLSKISSLLIDNETKQEICPISNTTCENQEEIIVEKKNNTIIYILIVVIVLLLILIAFLIFKKK